MQEYHPMSHELSKEEVSARFLGRRHKALVWSAIAKYNFEPPEPFYAQSIFRRIVQETGATLTPGNVMKEIDDFADMGMVERANAPQLSESAKAYRCVPDSPGWLIVNGVVEALDTMFPGQ